MLSAPAAGGLRRPGLLGRAAILSNWELEPWALRIPGPAIIHEVMIASLTWRHAAAGGPARGTRPGPGGRRLAPTAIMMASQSLFLSSKCQLTLKHAKKTFCTNHDDGPGRR
jgi:hypothetical protein